MAKVTKLYVINYAVLILCCTAAEFSVNGKNTECEFAIFESLDTTLLTGCEICENKHDGPTSFCNKKDKNNWTVNDSTLVLSRGIKGKWKPKQCGSPCDFIWFPQEFTKKCRACINTDDFWRYRFHSDNSSAGSNGCSKEKSRLSKTLSLLEEDLKYLQGMKIIYALYSKFWKDTVSSVHLSILKGFKT
jgi:hypothetical protein